MAQVGQTRSVTDSEGGSWQVFGTVDSETGAKKIILYGSTGQILKEGTASDIIDLVKQLPTTGPEDTFVQDVIGTVREIDISLSKSSPPPQQDTAASKISNTPNGTTSAGEMSASEKANLANVDTADISADPAVSNSEESPFGPNAKNYDFSKMTPEEIAAVGKFGGGSASSAAKLGPIPNPLHAYPSYTYSLSLHMLTIDEYNDIVEKQTYVPSRVIIAGAGRYNNEKGTAQFPRAPYFDEDFYFENLNIQTIIGLNETTRATNAINFSFDIVEPYGVTLFNRILKLTKQINPTSENYTEQPYLLQIDFFATDDTGVIVGPVPDQVKRLPIRILKFDIKVNGKGSQYHIEASAYNHSAYDLSTVSTPAHFEIAASSVAAFFQSTEAEIAATAVDVNNQREVQESTGLRKNTGVDGGYIGLDGQITYVNSALLSPVTQAALAITATGDPVYRVKSYGSAINAWQNELVAKRKIQFVDRYFFNFHPDIGEAKFDLSGKYAAKYTPMTGVERAKDAVKSNANNIEILSVDYNTQIFSINTGTSLEMVLNYVIRNSNYVQDQLVVPEDIGSDPQAYLRKKEELANKALRWFKIVPTIKLDPKKFDRIRKVWARDITYHVMPYEVYNTKISLAPQGTTDDPLKVYEYIFTGKNIDVLDFEIEFNALYYTAVTAYRDNIAGISGLPFYEEDKTKNVDNYTGTDDDPNAIQPLREKPQTLDARARATGSNESARSVAAVDVYESLYTTSGGDMLQAKLKIIGDPMYIKQDDVFYSPVATTLGKDIIPSIDPRLIANGSLRMDNREVYIKVNYRSPSDIDESTGLMKFDTGLDESVFSGMYKVLAVNSTFSSGQFIQTLETVRLPRQSKNKNTNNTASSVERNSDSDTKQLAPPAATTTDVAQQQSLTDASPAVDQTAPDNNPVEETAPDVTDNEQQQLAQINETAPTTTINEQNQTPSSPYPQAWEGIDALTFKEAFRRARAANGGNAGGVFRWRGKLYQTNIVGEAYVDNPVQVNI